MNGFMLCVCLCLIVIGLVKAFYHCEYVSHFLSLISTFIFMNRSQLTRRQGQSVLHQSCIDRGECSNEKIGTLPFQVSLNYRIIK
jgi:hypothetical protein